MEENENNRKYKVFEGIENDVGFKKQITSFARTLAEKLNKEIEKGNENIAFMLALLLALFKDFLDTIVALTAAEAFVPGITFVIGLFLTSFLFFFMLGKGWLLRWRLRLWFLFLGLFIDGIPFISAFFMNTFLVLYAWRLTKKRARNAKITLKNLDRFTDREITKLNEDISLLEVMVEPETESRKR